MKTDIEIAQAARMQPIADIAAQAGIPEECLEPYGKYKAKIDLSFLEHAAAAPGKLDPRHRYHTHPGGRGQDDHDHRPGGRACRRLGKSVAVALREPSLGPVFGMKGGAAGGGYAQVVPMEDINLHFTGDFHAIGAANNLLAAMLDNHIYQGNALGIDTAAHHLAAVRGHERPAAALRGGRPRRPGQRRPARGWIRHHGRFRGHGGAVPRGLGGHGPQSAPGPHRRRLHLCDGDPVTAGDLQGGGRDDRASKRRPEAQPRADARGHARARARRPVRQHRARVQLRDGDAHRDAPRRLCRDGGRLRRGPRRGEIFGHQVPAGGAVARRRWCSSRRCARSRCTAAWRRAALTAGESRRAGAGAAEPAPAREKHHARCSVCPASWRINAFPTDTDGGDWRSSRSTCA